MAASYRSNVIKKVTNDDHIVMVVDVLIAKVHALGLGVKAFQGAPYCFNGQYWERQDKGKFKQFLGTAAYRMGIYKTTSRHFLFQEKLFLQLMSITENDLSVCGNTTKINLKNGTLEIDDVGVSLKRFRADDHLTYQLPFEFDINATCPKFYDFLNTVLPDSELQDILAEFLGYILIPKLKLEKCLLLYGSGANGKSVIQQIVLALLGEENVSSFSLGDLNQEHNRAQVAGKLANFGSEIRGSMNMDNFKLAVSGERIQARFKYGNSFLIEHFPKLIFNCNELPKDVEVTEAFFRRLIVIPFLRTIPEEERNPELAKAIIESELPGVFNWVLSGSERVLQRRGFTQSGIVNDMLDNYRVESDSIQSFIAAEFLVASPDRHLLLKVLYEDYKKYCFNDKYSVIGRSTFSRRLRELGFRVERKNIGVVIYMHKSDGEK